MAPLGRRARDSCSSANANATASRVRTSFRLAVVALLLLLPLPSCNAESQHDGASGRMRRRALGSRGAVRLPLIHHSVLQQQRAYAHARRGLHEGSLHDSPLLAQGNLNPLGKFYIVVQMGSPSVQQTLTFATGSSTVWTACDCGDACPDSNFTSGSSYTTTGSTTYAAVSDCNAEQCVAAGGSCGGGSAAATACGFATDGGNVTGLVVQDQVTMRASTGDILDEPLTFGCASKLPESVSASEYSANGFAGFGPGDGSLIHQLAASETYADYFAFCLDSANFTASFVQLGKGDVAPAKLTSVPLAKKPLNGSLSLDVKSASYYDTPFFTGGTVIVDSSQPLTIMPAATFDDFVSAFGLFSAIGMETPATVPGYSNCYKLSGPIDLSPTVNPPIVITFAKGSWSVSNYYVKIGTTGYTYCLGITRGTAKSPFTIGASFLRDTYMAMDYEANTMSMAAANCSTLGNEVGILPLKFPPRPPNPPPSPPSPPPPPAPVASTTAASGGKPGMRLRATSAAFLVVLLLLVGVLLV